MINRHEKNTKDTGKNYRPYTYFSAECHWRPKQKDNAKIEDITVSLLIRSHEINVKIITESKAAYSLLQIITGGKTRRTRR